MLSSFDPPLMQMEGADSNLDQTHRIIAEHVPGSRCSAIPVTTPGKPPRVQCPAPSAVEILASIVLFSRWVIPCQRPFDPAIMGSLLASHARGLLFMSVISPVRFGLMKVGALPFQSDTLDVLAHSIFEDSGSVGSFKGLIKSPVHVKRP